MAELDYVQPAQYRIVLKELFVCLHSGLPRIHLLIALMINVHSIFVQHWIESELLRLQEIATHRLDDLHQARVQLGSIL